MSRSLSVPAAVPSSWCDAFIDGGGANLATRPVDGKERGSGGPVARPGKMLLERETLEQKIALFGC